jgi:hypothetical protein
LKIGRAHFYALTDFAFAHILGTFPLVPEPVKAAALLAFLATAK